MLSGVLRDRKLLGWAPRLSDWGELASALYEHLGWGRDLFELDYARVEGGQHEAALESLAGDHILRYLYDEFDDGKDVLVKTPHDMWQDVKGRVDLDSRRWFPRSAESFGKELNRIKQAPAYKGFAIDRGTVGRGRDKKRAIKVTRIDDVGTVGDSLGTVENAKTVPTENPEFAGESSGSEGVGTVGTVFSRSSSVNKKRKIGRRRKSSRQRTVPTVPAPEKQGENGVDKPNGAGTVPAETTVPEPSPNGGQLSPDGYTEITSENVADYLKELEGE
jgi:hypothetical protein